MVKPKTKKLLAQISIGLGLLVVFGTHIGMLLTGLPQELIIQHSIINLVAGVLISFGYWFKR